MNLSSPPDPENIRLSRPWLRALPHPDGPRPPRPIEYTWLTRPRHFALPDSPLPLLLMGIGGAMAGLGWLFYTLLHS